MSHAWTLRRFEVCTYTSNSCPPGSEERDFIDAGRTRYPKIRWASSRNSKNEDPYLYVIGALSALHARAAPLGMYLGSHPNACHVYIEDSNLTFLLGIDSTLLAIRIQFPITNPSASATSAILLLLAAFVVALRGQVGRVAMMTCVRSYMRV